MDNTKNIIKCPACGSDMEKVFLEKQGFTVNVCLDGCGGIYADNKVYKKISEQTENIDSLLEKLENKHFAEIDHTKRILCPACKHKMVKNFSSHLKKIEIDECYNCGGKFLDNKKLIQIRSEFKDENERSAEFKKYIQKLGLPLKK